MTRVKKMGVATAAASSLAVGLALTVAAPAQAASWQCSHFQYTEGFRARVCTKAVSSTRIEHKTLVQNLKSYRDSTYVSAYAVIGGSLSDCKRDEYNSFAAGETRAWSCYTKRANGTKYQTRGYVGSPGVSITSPGVWG